MIPTTTDTNLAAARIFNRIFTVEHGPDSSFVLKLRRSGEVVGGGWTGKRSAELPLERETNG